MQKYNKVFEEMIKENEEMFREFEEIGNIYLTDKSKQKEFNEIGDRIMSIVLRYERILCGHSENSGFGKFSGGLADRFRSLIRERYPYFDDIGLC